MAAPTDTTSMALFCDFENVALGVRDANYEKFDIKRVLERLLLKGSIVVKKAYCDWDRYKQFKGTMHEANFELIEIPHVRQSGKNSADIRLVVDALDLCYTKSHVNTFVIISGDSDFSPLVSKLRENAKQVIGVGVKQSTSDLLIANCDEFIFYDDLVREQQRQAQRKPADTAPPARRGNAEEEARRRDDPDRRRTRAIEIAVETLEALVSERGDSGKIRASVLKDAIKRRRPDFSESRYGYRTFGALLEDAQGRGLLEVERDDKGNAYVQRGSAPPAAVPAVAPANGPAGLAPPPRPAMSEPARPSAPRGERSPRRRAPAQAALQDEPREAAPDRDEPPVVVAREPQAAAEPVESSPAAPLPAEPAAAPAKRRRARKGVAETAEAPPPAETAPPPDEAAPPPDEAAPAPAQRPGRPRRGRKPAANPEPV